MGHEHVERAKKTWEEFQAGNIAAVFEQYDDNVVIHFSGRHKFAGDVKGRDGLMDYYVKFLEAFPGFKMEPHSVTGDKEHLIQLVKTTYVHEDETHTDNMVIVSHIGENGLITEEWFQDGDQYAVDEFVGKFYPNE